MDDIDKDVMPGYADPGIFSKEEMRQQVLDGGEVRKLATSKRVIIQKIQALVNTSCGGLTAANREGLQYNNAAPKPNRISLLCRLLSGKALLIVLY